MSRGRSTASIVASPVLIGAVTTLIIIVAVFLAYNANQGLPFVPTTQVKFRVANGANLLPGNEIREGGAPAPAAPRAGGRSPPTPQQAQQLLDFLFAP